MKKFLLSIFFVFLVSNNAFATKIKWSDVIFPNGIFKDGCGLQLKTLSDLKKTFGTPIETSTKKFKNKYSSKQDTITTYKWKTFEVSFYTVEPQVKTFLLEVVLFSKHKAHKGKVQIGEKKENAIKVFGTPTPSKIKRPANEITYMGSLEEGGTDILTFYLKDEAVEKIRCVGGFE